MPSVATGFTSVDWLMNHARRHPLLTADEEIKLSRQVQAWISIREKEELTKQEEKTVRIGRRAYEKFFLSNIRLVVQLAGKYARRCRILTVEDLIQEGMFGLERAVMKFDYTRGYKFSTYAYSWVKQCMLRAIFNQDRPIRLPCNAYETLAQAQKYMSSVFAETGAMPSMEEVAKHLKVDYGRLKAYFLHLNAVMSLDAQFGEESKNGLTRLDTIADPNSLEDPLDRVKEPVGYIVSDLVAQLTPTEQEIIQLRYFSNQPVGYPRIAQEIGTTRQTCNNIHNKALKKLRNQITSQRVKWS